MASRNLSINFFDIPHCRDLCERLADLSDTLIRDVQDSLILQPAYLDIATTKRKADEVKSCTCFFLVCSFSYTFLNICLIFYRIQIFFQADFGIVFEYSLTGAGAHLVSEVRFGSVARQTGRIEKGDEVHIILATATDIVSILIKSLSFTVTPVTLT